jgi:hypothetical protein
MRALYVAFMFGSITTCAPLASSLCSTMVERATLRPATAASAAQTGEEASYCSGQAARRNQ